MDWLDSLLGQLPTILTSSGLTGGGLLILSYFMLQRGIVHTDGEYQTALKNKDDAHKVALEAKDEAMAAVVAAHQVVVKVVTEERQRSDVDRDHYRESTDIQRDRADKVQSRMIEEVVPLIRVTNAALNALPKIGGE